jgi:hypothetical protein
MIACRARRLGVASAALLALQLGPSPGAAPAGTPSVEFPIAYIEARLAGELIVMGQEQARPKIEGDRSSKVQLADPEGGPPLTARWKPVAPPGHGFNNEPRYELAAYRLQQLFLKECEYVVPPAVLRALPVDEYRRIRGGGEATLRGTDSALFLLSYWLAEVTNRDPWDERRFATDARYARHWGNLNILTHLIDHKDANVGNLLISLNPEDPRIFAVDNDVAFRSDASDVGDTWRHLQVDRLPQETLARLRLLDGADLEAALGVLAEFELRDGQLHPAPLGQNLGAQRGVRVRPDRVQFGLTRSEIREIERRMNRLLLQVDRGRITAVEGTTEALGQGCLASSHARG